MKDFQFKNIRIEGDVPRLVNFEFEPESDCTLENVLLEKIVVTGKATGSNQLRTTKDTHKISDIVFKDCFINGQALTESNAESLGQFTISGNVENVRFVQSGA